MSKFLTIIILLSVGLKAEAYDIFFPACSRYWVTADYLYWKMKDTPKAPALVIGTSLDIPVFTPDDFGAVTLIGDESINNEWRSGLRLSAGTYLDPCEMWGVEASYFFLPSQTHKNSVSADGRPGSPVISVPYINALNCAPSIIPIAFNGQSGSAKFKLKNWMQGFELNGLCSLPWNCFSKVGFIAGFKFWNYQEDLSFETTASSTTTGALTLSSKDTFKTRNNFYGAQIGLSFDYLCNCFYVNLKGKLAFGGMYRKVDINGSFTQLTLPPAPAFIFASSATNIGKHRKTVFSVIPELDFNIGCELWRCLRLQLGYTFMYVSNIGYATRQINNVLNPNFFPGGSGTGVKEPKPLNKNSNFYVHGLNVGLEYSF